MCKRESPDKNEPGTKCVRVTPQIQKKREGSMRGVRKTSQLKNVSMGCVRESPQIKINPARDVQEKLPRLKKKNLKAACEVLEKLPS